MIQMFDVQGADLCSVPGLVLFLVVSHDVLKLIRLLIIDHIIMSQAQTTLTTNDIVISKLTQILSYLRQGTRHKKIKKKDKGNFIYTCSSRQDAEWLPWCYCVISS